MRLEPTEESMYRRMDLKDQMLMMIPVFGILASLGLFLLASPAMFVPGLVMLAAAISGMCGSMGMYSRIKRRIMPLAGCFLEIQTNCFVAVQPYRDNRYESCRVYYHDVTELIRGAGNKGFYIRISEQGESVIQDEADHERRVLFINPFGYSKDGVEEIYAVLKKRVPGTTDIYEPVQ